MTTATKTLLLALALTARSCSAAGWANHDSAWPETGYCYGGGGAAACAMDQMACTLGGGGSWYDHTSSATLTCSATTADAVQYDAPVTKDTFASPQTWTAYSCAGHGWTATNGGYAITPVLTSSQCSGSGVCATGATKSSSMTFTDDALGACTGTKTWMTFGGAVTYTAHTKNVIELVDTTNIVAGMAVTGTNIPDNTFVDGAPANSKVTLITMGTTDHTGGKNNVPGDTTAAVPASTDLKFYPTQVLKASAVKYGSCYSMTTHKSTPVYGIKCPAGSSFLAHGEVTQHATAGEYTSAEAKIGYCYSSTCNSPTGVAIPGGGYCAVSADMCDYDRQASTECNHGVQIHGQKAKFTLTESECTKYSDGVCTDTTGTFHNHMTFNGDDKTTCDDASDKTWLVFPNAGGVTFTNTPFSATVQTFKPFDHADNPGCVVDDIIGEPAPVAAVPARCPTVSGAAALAPAFTASVAIAAAVGSALMA